MQINVNIILAADDSEVSQTPDQVASSILQALNGNADKDVVSVFVHRPSEQMGSAGSLPVAEVPASPATS